MPGKLGPAPKIRGIRVTHGALLRIQRQQRQLAQKMRRFNGTRTGIIAGTGSKFGKIARGNDQALQNQLERITKKHFTQNAARLEQAMDKLISRVWAHLDRQL